MIAHIHGPPFLSSKMISTSVGVTGPTVVRDLSKYVVHAHALDPEVTSVEGSG